VIKPSIETIQPAVETVQLTKRYGRSVALRGLDLTVRPGEVFGYLGPNGAGKTTTLRLLLGLLRPSGGRAAVLGHDCWREQRSARRLIGYLPGEVVLYDRLTGHQHVRYFARLRQQPADASRATDLADRFGLDLGTEVHQLSKGNRQKLGVVLALMSAPPVLILDEPTSGLDPLGQEQLLDLVREHATAGGAVLLSSHALAEVQRVADRVGILRAGRLVAVRQLAELRASSLHRVTARVSDELRAAEFAGIPGISELRVTGGQLSCRAAQPALDPLVKLLGRHRVVELECAEAELAETFLDYYADQPGTDQPEPVVGEVGSHAAGDHVQDAV